MEIWDAYLKDGSLAGRDLVRGEPIPNGMYHLVCEILVRHTDGDYLLMQRDPHKPNYGGYYEATAGGSALKGEDKLSCALRELEEETGIKATLLKEIGHSISHNTIYFNFLCVTDHNKSSVLLQPGETISYKWMNECDFISFIHSSQMIPSQKEHYHNFFVQMGYMEHTSFSSAYRVRRLTEADTELIYTLCKGNTQYYEYCGKDISVELIQSDLKITPPRIPPDQKYYVGLFDGDKLVAVMDLIDGYPNSSYAFIGFFMMDRALQGLGIGSRIISDVLTCLRNRGFKTCQLGIDKDNPQSNHFWRKNGFEVIREVALDEGIVLLAEKQL